LENRVKICCAGGAAAGLLSGKDFDWTGAQQDRQQAADLSECTHARSWSEDTPAAYGRYLELRARDIVGRHRYAVEAFAKVLFEKRRLGFRAVCLVLDEAAAADSVRKGLGETFAGKKLRFGSLDS
jgi:hypothetical protein